MTIWYFAPFLPTFSIFLTPPPTSPLNWACGARGVQTVWYTFNKLKVNFFFVSFRDFALATSALFANEHKEKLSAGNDEETRRSQFCACDLTAYSGTYFQVHKHERRLCHTLCWLVKGFFQKNSGNNWSDDFDYFMQKEDLNMHRDKKKTSDHAQVTWPIKPNKGYVNHSTAEH